MFATLLMMTMAASDSHLPPLIDWKGKSESLLQTSGPLTTDFELSLGIESPDYATSVQFIERLVAANPTQFSQITIGTSDEGRAIPMIVATEQNQFSPAMLKNNNKPTILIQAGIHAGEIDGKDAGFMLLRDIATGKRRDILSKVNILFIPILNVDGHERSSIYNRINQRGPVVMGFRTNAKNLNLNRDYTKLDTPEIRAVLKVINEYEPALYIDVHVTDGADYQYDVTYGFNPHFSSEAPAISSVLEDSFKPLIDAKLEHYGHIPGPLVFAMDKRDFKKGLAGWVATPRFSNGWGDLRGLPSILVENHSLKPYKQRVLGTYAFFDGVVDAISRHYDELQTALKNERSFIPGKLVVDRAYAKEPDFISFKGIEYARFDSALSGTKEAKYLGKPLNYEKLPIFWQKEVKKVVDVPKYFFIPPVYANVVTKLKLHGIEVTNVSSFPEGIELKQLSVDEFQFDKLPFEGRMRVSASFEGKRIERDIKGWYQVNTQQAFGELAVHLLHPEAPDSFFQWGEFNTIFQRTEYVENYALEPYARNLLKENPNLALEFDALIRENKSFANDPEKRMDWLYRQTPFYDQAYLQYPIILGVIK
jgi:hypothetical protein